MPSARATAEADWRARLEEREDDALRRRLDVHPTPSSEDGAAAVNLASNDYLGLSTDARVTDAAARAAKRWGAGAGASRLVTGHRAPHAELENALADFKKAERALVFSSGYAANVGVLTALAEQGDFLFCDRLNHASLIDGARLSRGTVRVYRHGDSEHLDELLDRAPAEGRCFIVTDGVFSMDGELAPLPELVRLAERHDALLVVDDAHGTGALGPGGRGTVAHFGLEEEIPVRIGTLSKALGAQGGFVVGSDALVSLLVNEARAFVYSTGLAPPLAAAAREALRIAAEDDARRRRLHEHLRALREGLRARGYALYGEAPAPLLAVRFDTPEAALRQSDRLADANVTAPAIRPPTVPDGTSRIRLAPMATHSSDDVQRVLEAFGSS
ncbi:MAG: 8-amino-7-oxononanoate synthase [Bacteroidetes bacterium QS_8_68_15]|nr:MAG: 8-amino-7-oxononanoate synthase [Bacteroidetes bacterium QS_8_68_15]